MMSVVGFTTRPSAPARIASGRHRASAFAGGSTAAASAATRTVATARRTSTGLRPGRANDGEGRLPATPRLLLVLALLLAGCGGAPERPAEPRPAAPRAFTVGEGASSATVFVPPGGGRGRVGVVFLHGWGAPRPEVYGPWIRHLVGRGHVVIHPRYQESFVSPPAEALPNVLVGVRGALTRVRPRALVAVGHSAGGALAADLAAVAGRAGIPPPRAVLALYPGRSLRGLAPRLPAADLSAIPPGTRVVALAGATDRVVGTRTARAIARGATRAETSYALIGEPAVSDHRGPQRATPAARRAFWRRLDALIAATT